MTVDDNVLKHKDKINEYNDVMISALISVLKVTFLY